MRLNHTLQGEFIVPDYYKNFTCKGGHCRNTCCSGWSVKISQNQYYQLLGLDTTQELKQVIDRSFRMCLSPTEASFAEIAHTYEGVCPLLSKEGWCRLHQTFGETVLPSVCRYYPKGPKQTYLLESSCSNSCEKTLELLLADDKVIQFEPMMLSFDLSVQSTEKTIEERSHYSYLRSHCFQFLSDRHYSLPDRIRKWGCWLSEQGSVKMIETEDSVNSIDIGSLLSQFYPVVHHLLNHHQTLSEWIGKEEVFFETGKAVDYYQEAKKKLEETFPLHEIYFEKIIMNHLFFSEYPFSSARVNQAYLQLTGLYVFLRIMILILMPITRTIEQFIDVMSKLFRVIAHGPFEHNLVVFMVDEGLVSNAQLSALLYL